MTESPKDNAPEEQEDAVVEETAAPDEPVAEEAPATEAAAEEPAAEEAPATEAAAEEAPAETATEEAPESEQPEPAAAEPKKPADRKRKAPKKEPVAKEAAKPATGRKRPSGEPGQKVSATARYVRVSPRKARLVCDHIRGKSVVEARAILAHTPRAVAHDWSKLLESAVANAEHNHELVGDELKILSVVADEGPTIKRFRPRAMGRASRIRKRTSHLSIVLTPKE